MWALESRMLTYLCLLSLRQYSALAADYGAVWCKGIFMLVDLVMVEAASAGYSGSPNDLRLALKQVSMTRRDQFFCLTS